MKVQQKCDFRDHYFEVDIKKIRVNKYTQQCPEYENYTEICRGSIQREFNGIELHLSRQTGGTTTSEVTEKYAICPICEREVMISRSVKRI